MFDVNHHVTKQEKQFVWPHSRPALTDRLTDDDGVSGHCCTPDGYNLFDKILVLCRVSCCVVLCRVCRAAQRGVRREQFRLVPLRPQLVPGGWVESQPNHGRDECGWHSGDHRLSSLSVSCLVLNEQPPSLLWMLLWSSVSLGLLLPSKPTMSTSSGTREKTVSPCVWGQHDTFIKQFMLVFRETSLLTLPTRWTIYHN